MAVDYEHEYQIAADRTQKSRLVFACCFETRLHYKVNK